MMAVPEPIGDMAARAAAVTTAAELAVLLRELRRRESRDRHGRMLTYQQLADSTNSSMGSIAAYLNGMTLPPTERFDVLLRLLGVRPHEHGPLATARDRVDDAQRPLRVLAGPGAAMPVDWSTRAALMLPAVPRAFTGRIGALARLDGMLAETAGAGAVVVTAVAGMGGIGKTTLAVHWGHSTMDRFPGGQLYVNLRGYDPGEPLSTLDALGALLTGLGAPPAAIPPDEAGRLSLYQEQLRGRRTLVLLDNARSSAHVQQLLPPSPCLALITSRDDLAELAAAGDVRRIRLDVFAEDEAIALLRQLIGDRADHEPETIRALAKRCGYLPLALRVVAELAASRPKVMLSALVDELESDYDATGLDAFDTGDLRSDLRAVITWSVRSLPEPAARALRLLGLVPGTDVDEYGLAALAGVTPAQAADLLATLRGAHLVEPWPPGRYGMHDLVRAYARTMAHRDLDAADRQTAMTRLLDYYLTATTVATGTLIPGASLRSDRSVPEGEVDIPALQDLDTAAAWLDAERANLVAACVLAAHNGWPSHAVAMAAELWAHLEEAHQHDAIAVHTAALTAADAAGAGTDPRDRARLLAALALAHLRLDNLDNAAALVEESIVVSNSAGDVMGSILPLTVLGNIRIAQGRFAEASTAWERVFDLAGTRGPGAHIQALLNLCELDLTLERYEEAEKRYRQAASLAVSRPTCPGASEFGGWSVAVAHRGLAHALVHLGRCAEAIPIAERAVMLIREDRRPTTLVAMLETAAKACVGAGQLDEALDHLAEAVELCRDIPSTYPAALTFNTLGETYRHTGDHTLARASHEEALDMADRAHDRVERTRALVGLGDAHAALGDLSRARDLWQTALADYTEMGLPAAARVEARLQDVR